MSESNQREYIIAFPPKSSMGLELEPVITSTNPPRQIGCRVKDFYFGTDFSEGFVLPNSDIWTREYLTHRIQVGDVVCKVDDDRVVSKSFTDILTLLRTLKNSETHRLVTFRNISAHCKFCSII